MSYDDGDVSMASIKDESFNMSVDHDTFDVVWHSTQQPAIQSILEESKFQQRQRPPQVWDPNQTPSMAGCFATAPKSLFKDPSSTRTVSLLGPHSTPDIVKEQPRIRPGMGRVTSSPDMTPAHPTASLPLSNRVSLGSIPTDLRKIRPSQRRKFTQTVEYSASGMFSGKSGHERTSQGQPAGSIENLENLRKMIKSVGKTWEKGDSSPVSPLDSKGTSSTDRPPSRTKHVGASVGSGINSNSAPYSGEGSHGSKATKPRLATTIKVPIPAPERPNAFSLRSCEPKGLMLPPSLPTQRAPSTKPTSLRFPSKGPPELGDRPGIESGMQPERNCLEHDEFPKRYFAAMDEPLSPSPRTAIFPSQHSQSAGFRYSTPPPARNNAKSAVNPLSQQQLEQIASVSHPSSSQIQPKKALGMRRTLSGNRFEPNTSTPSQHHPTTRQIKQSLPTILSQDTSRLTSPATESPEPLTEAPIPTPAIPLPTPAISLPPPGVRISTELASRPKSFKVPWAASSANTSPVEQRQPPSSQSSGGTTSPLTTTSASPSSPYSLFDGSIAARAMAMVEDGAGDTVMIDSLDLGSQNPDSSYSFDDIDTEELDRVLSQRGA